MTTKHILTILAVLVLAGCQSAGIKTRARELDESITNYSVGLRWSMLDVIEQFHKERDGEHPALDRDAMEKVRITKSTVLKQDVNKDITEATIKGEIDYYMTDSGTLKKLNFSQDWWYDPEIKKWYIEGSYIDFK